MIPKISKSEFVTLLVLTSIVAAFAALSYAAINERYAIYLQAPACDVLEKAGRKTERTLSGCTVTGKADFRFAWVDLDGIPVSKSQVVSFRLVK